MDEVIQAVQKRASALLDLSKGNEQAVSSRLLPLGMHMFRTQKITDEQAEEMGAIAIALLSLWRTKGAP